MKTYDHRLKQVKNESDLTRQIDLAVKAEKRARARLDKEYSNCFSLAEKISCKRKHKKLIEGLEGVTYNLKFNYYIILDSL